MTRPNPLPAIGSRVRNFAPILLLAALGMALNCRALGYGLCIDDHGLQAGAWSRGPFSIFNFNSGDPASLRSLASHGAIPWFTAGNLKLSFWRPLASLSHWADFVWLQLDPGWMHWQNLIWYGLLVCMAGGVYRRLIAPRWAWILATALFAINDAHAISVGWIAARNSLMAQFFSLACLWAHDRWVRDRWRAGAYWAPLMLGLGLLSAEAAVATVGILAGHSLFMNSSNWRRRLRALTAHAVVTALWLGCYAAGNHGARGSGHYLDPTGEPGVYLAALPGRFLGYAAMEFWPILTSRFWLAMGALVLTAVCLGVLVASSRPARFFAFGLVVTTAVTCCHTPDPVFPRMLIHVSFPVFALVALAMAGAFSTPEASRRPRWWQAVSIVSGIGWVLQLAVLAPLRIPWEQLRIVHFEAATILVTRGPPTGMVAGKTVLFVNSGLPISGSSLLGENGAARVRALAVSSEPVRVTVVDDHTVRIRQVSGMFRGPFSSFYRRENDPMPAGTEVHLAGMSIKITGVDPQLGPVEAEYRFEQPLSDPSYVWVSWQDKQYDRYELPLAGQTAEVAPVSLPGSVVAKLRGPPRPADEFVGRWLDNVEMAADWIHGPNWWPCN